MLRVYIAHDCLGSQIALRLAATLQRQHPALPLEVVDVGAAGALVPEFVFGTPTYVWNEQILFLGNPAEAELLDRMRSLYAAPA